MRNYGQLATKVRPDKAANELKNFVWDLLNRGVNSVLRLPSGDAMKFSGINKGEKSDACFELADGFRIRVYTDREIGLEALCVRVSDNSSRGLNRAEKFLNSLI